MAPFSAENCRDAVYDFFIDRHVALKPEWFDAVVRFLDAKAKPKTFEAACALVFDQWKFADLGNSTYPTLRPIHINHCRFEGNCVLQVISCVDISVPALSQLKKCAIQSADNSEFSAEPISEREEANRYEPKNRRMLKLVLSDGESTIGAIEFEPIEWLKPSILPGAKILFHRSIDCRRKVLLLTPKNCQKLGGEVGERFKTNLLSVVLAKQLGKKLKLVDAEDVFGDSGPLARSESVTRPQEVTRPLLTAAPVVRPTPLRPVSTLEVGEKTSTPVPPPKTYSFGLSKENPIVLGASPIGAGSSALPRSSTPRGEAPLASESMDLALEIEDDFSSDGYYTPLRNREDREQAHLASLIEEYEDEIVPETPPPIDDSFNDDAGFLSPVELEQISRNSEIFAPSPSEPPPPKKYSPYPERQRPPFTPFQDVTNMQEELSPIAIVPKSIARPAQAAPKISIPRIPEEAPWGDEDCDFTPNATWKDPAKKITVNRKKCAQMQSSIQSFVTPKPTAPRISQIPQRSIKKEESDDEIMILSPIKQEPTELCKPSSSRVSISQRRSLQFRPMEAESNEEENPFVKKFKKLTLTTIAAAVKFMKFAVGSKRFEIIAIVKETKKALRVIDGEWSMVLLLEDESAGDFECFVAHALLCDLIGLTPQEATAIRDGTDSARKRDGQNRIASIGEQLERLDLVFTVELFARNKATPRICGLDTLTSKMLA